MGGGQKRKTEEVPNLTERLEALVESYTKGDPMRPLRWTSKSTHKLSAELKSEGIPVSPNTVGSILESLDKGWVNVGISSDTAAFAVNSIRCWYYQMGQADYTKTDSLLITADCGGSNSNRTRLWKVELQKLADEIHKTIHVCHFPPGTSKWNKIEHKMFCFITMNRRGKPLISQQTVVQLISNTTSKSGLTIKTALDENAYQKGLTVPDEELAKVNLAGEKFHGEWNYRIEPNKI